MTSHPVLLTWCDAEGTTMKKVFASAGLFTTLLLAGCSAPQPMAQFIDIEMHDTRDTRNTYTRDTYTSCTGDAKISPEGETFKVTFTDPAGTFREFHGVHAVHIQTMKTRADQPAIC
jgi:hypothetical protein